MRKQKGKGNGILFKEPNLLVLGEKEGDNNIITI